MPYSLVAYEKLKADIKKDIIDLVSYHKLDENKLEESINKLPDERKVQVKFFEKSLNF